MIRSRGRKKIGLSLLYLCDPDSCTSIFSIGDDVSNDMRWDQ